MSPEDNKAVVRRLYQAFSTGDLKAMEDVVATNAVDFMSLEGQAPGVEGFKERITGFRKGFPDLTITIEAMVAEGDMVESARCSAALTAVSLWAFQRPANR